ncbi:hypothetical protein niasHS_010169 [Heterodera schachtii]|uniref:HMG box domain-containing protein n=1 Tax=Heterodera schachtii TaxID=97005 RepID=A0ABD2J424_HETSC
MSKAVASKTGSTTKRKRKADGGGTNELASEEIKMGRKNVKTAKKEPTTSSADDNILLKTEETELDRNDRAESSPSTATQPAMMPKEMYNFCKSILEIEEKGNVNLTRLKGNTKFSQLLRDNPMFDDSVDISAFQNSFTHFYRWATILSDVSLSKALHTVMEYAQSEHMVFRHPNYPKRPQNAFTRFAQLTGSNLFKSNGQTSADYKNDQDPRVVKAKQEYAKDRERYLAKLREFLNSHTDELFEGQIQYLHKEIKNTQKSIEQKEPPKSRRSNGIKQPQKQLPTAFDLYKRSKGQKYEHLPSEERDAKLRRHFEKLSAEQREIYESIAASLQ